MRAKMRMHDTISPELAKMARQVRNRVPILRAMGAALQSWITRSFNDPAKRMRPWEEKKSGGALLKRSGTMWRSFRLTRLTNEAVTVGTDRPYARWHQYGTDPYVIRPKLKKALSWPGAAHPVRKVNHPGLPARPFFPFTETGTMFEPAKRSVREAGMLVLRRLLGR